MIFLRQNQYDRTTAVNYALKYALTPNPAYRYFPLDGDRSGDCANFLSQCIKAGGAPMRLNSNNSWWYNTHNTFNVKEHTWSIPWSVAHSLYWYLKTNSELRLPYVKGLEVQNIHMLEAGDLIFFENSNGAIFHSAIVTATSEETPLICQHSFEARNIPYNSSWPSNKIHYLKISI